MPTIDEVFQDPISTPVHDALVAGVDVLAGPQEITFTPYVRIVLPIDGFVFYVNAALATPAVLATAGLEVKTGHRLAPGLAEAVAAAIEAFMNGEQP